jgi:hypothetical protein
MNPLIMAAETQEFEDSPGYLKTFRGMSSGTQRVIIAVIVVVVLIAVAYLRELIMTEESVRLTEEAE